MIAATVEELTPLIGTRPACRALGASPATIYRRRRPPEPRPPRPRPTPARALSEPERQQVLEVLHSERFVDVSPEETWATLLDEGTYLCSTRTMYRILAAHHGGVRERRDQLTHPPYAKPELLAERPNELWSWDVSKLKGPAKWTWFYLYVILDVFSRYVVGWTVQYRENAQLAKALIEQATEQQQITPKILTLHADRGAPQRAKPVAFLLADLGVTKTHSRPYTSSDNPYSESNFKTLKYRPEFPARFDDIEHARAHCRAVLRLVQPPAPPLRDRADDPRRRPPRPRARSYTPPGPQCSTPPTSGTPNGSSASRRPRRSCRPRPGSTSRRRSPPLTKFEREASHRAWSTCGREARLPEIGEQQGARPVSGPALHSCWRGTVASVRIALVSAGNVPRPDVRCGPARRPDHRARCAGCRQRAVVDGQTNTVGCRSFACAEPALRVNEKRRRSRRNVPQVAHERKS